MNYPAEQYAKLLADAAVRYITEHNANLQHPDDIATSMVVAIEACSQMLTIQWEKERE